MTTSSIFISTAYDPFLYLWRARETVLDMLKDRGHTIISLKREPLQSFKNAVSIPPCPIRYSSVEEFQNDYPWTDQVELRDNMRIHSENGRGSHITLWSGSTVTRVADLREAQLTMEEHGSNIECLLICRGPMKSQGKAALKDMHIEGYKIEVFEENALQYNVTRHAKVPAHFLLKRAEIDALLKNYNATLDQLPIMSRDDPVARYYGAKTGNVFRILRPSDTNTGQMITYRAVKKVKQ